MSESKAFGVHGSITLNSGSGPKLGPFYAIQCIGEVTFTELDDLTEDSTGVPRSSLAFSDGFMLYGNFTEVDVATGAVTCYKSPARSLG